MNTMRYFLGVDGGGTHTRVLLADATGRILGSAKTGSTNRNHYPRETIRENLRQSILTALHGVIRGDEVAGIFLGVCGVSNDQDRHDIASILREIPELPATIPAQVENDARIGLTGGLPGRPGMVLIAGTGSACFGMTAAGHSLWCGGWGALVDDVGSAPWVGVQAMQAAVRAEDGRLGPTLLHDQVFKFLGLRHPREFIDRVHNHHLTREEIGKLAPHVLTAYTQDDAVAQNIIHTAVAELSLLVKTVAKKLFHHQPSELILVGGLALSGAPFQTLLTERITQDSPEVTVLAPRMSPVQGAILEALRAGGVAWSAEVLENVRSGFVDT